MLRMTFVVAGQRLSRPIAVAGSRVMMMRAPRPLALARRRFATDANPPAAKVESAAKPASEMRPSSSESLAKAALAQSSSTVSSVAAETPAASVPAAVELSRFAKVKKTIVDGAKHTWTGFKLFGTELRISTRLLGRVILGYPLTRRERRQMERTVGDIFRLIPFSIFIIVPFLEFALPIALKLFPGMLPSTFRDGGTKEENLKRNLRGRIELAKFFGDTVANMDAAEAKKKKKTDAGDEDLTIRDLKEFIASKRSDQGAIKDPTQHRDELIRFTRLFENKLTLEHLSRQQLISLCKLLQISPIAATAFLRFQLRIKLRSLRADDILIEAEGLSRLNNEELQKACESRGMRAYGVSRERLEHQLRVWLDLHLKDNVPSSLLLLSSAMSLPAEMPAEQRLEEAMRRLPTDIVEEADLAEKKQLGQADNEARLASVQREERLIAEEMAENELKAEKKKQKELLIKQQQEEEEAAAAAAEAATATTTSAAVEEAITSASPDVLATAASEMKTTASEDVRTVVAEARTDSSAPPTTTAVELPDAQTVIDTAVKKETTTKEEEDYITHEEMAAIGDAVSALKTKTKLSVERVDLSMLIAEQEERKEALSNAATYASELRETAGSKRLGKRVDKMIQRLEQELAHVDKGIESMRSADSEEIDVNCDGKVDADEMMRAMKLLKDSPDASKTKRLVEFLDTDKDGEVKIEELIGVVELLEEEDADVTPEHITEILDLLKKESLVKSGVHKYIRENLETKEE